MNYRSLIQPNSPRHARPYNIARSVIENYNQTFDLQLTEIELHEVLQDRVNSGDTARHDEVTRQIKILKSSIETRSLELQKLDSLILQCYHSQVNESTIKIA